MIGDAILYAVQRATSNAVGNVERKVAWTAAAGALLLCSLVAALVVAYQLLEPRIGMSSAVALISVACLLIGLFCLSMPNRLDRAQHEQAKPSRSASSVATTAAAIDEETKQAVDYFGAVRVVGAAFLFGLGAARKLKG
jgi:hypothetical protein